MKTTHLFGGMLLCLVCILFTGCSVIDEDLSDCQQNFTVHYAVRLRTQLTTQIATQLGTRFNDPKEAELAALLEDSLKNVFSEFAHDVDLSFYKNGQRSFRQQDDMEANQAVYELELPADNYRHLALANFGLEPNVERLAGDNQNTAYVHQIESSEWTAHKAGLFSARKDMDILGNIDQTFDVTLYMINSASILIIRTDRAVVDYRDIRVTSCDFADGFYINDSTFTYNNDRTVQDLRVTTPPVEREVFYSITFPSCDTPEEAQQHFGTRASGQTGAQDYDRIWRKIVYVTMPDGSITRTIINVRQPLKAGDVFIIYAYLNNDGTITSPNVEVGTSVTLNWQEGLDVRN